MCGEKRCLIAVRIFSVGSPPHVRGKDTPIGETGAMSGITPACAGKRMAFAVLIHSKQDHPRMCGEKLSDKGSRGEREGSPPHVRGKD